MNAEHRDYIAEADDLGEAFNELLRGMYRRIMDLEVENRVLRDMLTVMQQPRMAPGVVHPFPVALPEPVKLVEAVCEASPDQKTVTIALPTPGVRICASCHRRRAREGSERCQTCLKAKLHHCVCRKCGRTFDHFALVERIECDACKSVRNAIQGQRMSVAYAGQHKGEATIATMAERGELASTVPVSLS